MGAAFAKMVTRFSSPIAANIYRSNCIIYTTTDDPTPKIFTGVWGSIGTRPANFIMGGGSVGQIGDIKKTLKTIIFSGNYARIGINGFSGCTSLES